ncbi:MAG TPA: endonuclease MutS2 [Anaerolineales bacterium]|nr:endonuclease MutS2 [Anaerolineales bacterium]
MDEKSLEILEWPKVLDRLEAHAAFSASKDLARHLRPSPDLTEIRVRQAETAEARRLLEARSGLTIGGAHDVRPDAEAARRGLVLEPQTFLGIKSTLIAAREVQRLLERVREAYPVLAARADELKPAPGLVDAITRVLDEYGEVRDQASEKLAEIRVGLRAARERLLAKLDRIIHDPKLAPMLQDPIVTQRDGRFVVPLRAEFKGRIKSLIHDQSSSGATLFVEPLSVVDLNNEMRELELAERDEVRRILAELSALVGGQAEAVSSTVAALAMIDLALAKARYAERLEAARPEFVDFGPTANRPHPGSRLHLGQARHPLLDPSSVVPMDIVLDEDTYALVITGPNTGGKTVALKTAGLLVAMAQAGLALPALTGSRLTPYDNILADIGDEQSIEQSLSTFSSHIANILHILQAASPHSLVLLDELGAGTDPQEGSALARSILQALLERGVTTLVATHYPELKLFAHNTPGVRNASVEFDLASLRPTYRLMVGLPGRSNALAIAERLGLDRQVIERARQMVAPEEIDAQGLLDEIQRSRDDARRERSSALAEHERGRKVRAELEARLAAIDEERKGILEAARRETEEQVEALRGELDELRRRMTASRLPLEAVDQVEQELEDLAESLPESEAETSAPSLPVREIKAGDRVRVASLGMDGTVVEIGEGQVEVLMGRLRLRVRPDELTEPQAERHMPRRDTRAEPADMAIAAPPLEIDVRGQTVEEALDALERRLDAAFLAGLPFIRVIHGKGTGRLRQAIRQTLRRNPYAASFESGSESEGGEGVTVVRLAVG